MTDAAAPPSQEATRLQRPCEEAIQRAMQEPALPGTPALDSRRAELLYRVKSQPVLFSRAPEYAPSEDPAVLSYRRWWRNSPHPGGVVAHLIAKVPTVPELLSAVVLREGYLYADDLGHAQALVRLLRAEHLFQAPEIVIQRGAELLFARRTDGVYRYTNGPEPGELVTLLLFDRVAVGAIDRPVHADVRALRVELGFERFEVLRQSAEHVVARLHYGRFESRGLFERDGARLRPVCEQLGSDGPQLVAWRQERQLLNAAFRTLQGTLLQQVRDGLPFDEPLHEVGQEDGKLRRNWRRAYDSGWDAYRYRGDVYPVFGPRGQPLVPQVCVDFLLDTLERSSGTWWSSAGEPRRRILGALDFERFDRDALRRVPHFVEFASEQTEWFDVMPIAAREQVPMTRAAFFEYLRAHPSDFVPGDMVLIGGHVPWDPRYYVHYHSFFIVESDPLTGLPIAIASNPGRPRQTTWDWEARRTPKRTLRYRIRPRARWLSSVVKSEPSPWLPSLSAGAVPY